MDITKKERDCIVVIHDNSKPLPLRLSDVAGLMNIKPPTAHELINRLLSKNIIKKERGMITLTDYGNEIYSEIMMAHRTLEIILTRSGVNSDKACTQVEKVDYLMDTSSIEKLLQTIGNPDKCPHGKPVHAV
ncbi:MULTISPECIES: metal-dependent transcriptional regulator [Acidiplasma]|jgi:DtxR family Mn-dependent transcriptional regulator|uniref:Iron-dependent repressor n=2 Tax=Acidiplasma TaxID=507753 RepID=A0A0Q0VRG7_9ARCH|nr:MULTISPECIES: metal-dependent transcriptional regulator [Acidiplasma]KJE49142.1 iron-dependent repressor [Acidiplasma sp. MBA-1]KPV47362.1 iron-dependent repressor [Acidiplasma aeolicum]KQB36221.1 iron-dependent repressor [Acidiplasma aeolicum]KQB36466.1 iron-dependent repressor [Acidiplasma cupricumulans]WMT54924.1 MAG: metal-dependent transcriptional regulator [Acidiplasma sp.]